MDRLTGRVAAATAGLVALVALAAGAAGGLREALGALAGGAIMLGNFLWLDDLARRAVAPIRRGHPRGRRWWMLLGAARVGAVGLCLGLAVVTGAGLGGLLASLGAWPIVALAEGLRAAREE